MEHELERLASRMPTRHTKTALRLLVVFEVTILSLIAFINPITFDLSVENLTWLQVTLALFLALAASLFVNFHLTRRLVAVSQWVESQEWVQKPQKDSMD